LVWKLLQNEKKNSGTYKFSGLVSDQKALSNTWIPKVRKWIAYGYGLVVLLICLALAKPFNWRSQEAFNHQYAYGIDIVIAMDISASMLAKDFEPDRLTVSKEMAKEFIDSRYGDRIGLVVYEGEAYTACPATLDYEVVKSQIDAAQPGNLEGGTAIGTGLGTAVTRLRNKDLKSKVIILLTDGSNNSGTISPETAAALAKEKSIRVYTIGVGSKGLSPTPIMTPFGVQFENMPVDIDEETLQSIASITGGKYFRATDASGLRSIYKEIDRMEKREIKAKNYTSEPPISVTPFLLSACILMFIIQVVKRIVLKSNE
jgi:Ca-activated chloride channel family protein